MKKYILKRVQKTPLALYSLLFMLCCFIPSLHAQEISEEQLIGIWLFNYDASFAKMETKTKTQFDSFTEERKDKIEKNYSGRKMLINTDGTFLQLLSDGREAKGTWYFNKNSNSLEITDPNGRKHEQKIKSLNETVLILKPIGIGKGTMLITELHYTKL